MTEYSFEVLPSPIRIRDLRSKILPLPSLIRILDLRSKILPLRRKNKNISFFVLFFSRLFVSFLYKLEHKLPRQGN